MQYVAFLRGVNVGGNSLIKMSTLKEALLEDGLLDVQTYIQSGNILFASTSKDKKKLAQIIVKCISRVFKLNVAVAIYTGPEWQQVIAKAPSWWGKDPEWRHNALIMIEASSAKDTVKAIGDLRPGMEKLQAGNGMLYASIGIANIGRGVTGSKLISNPVYKLMTIRNYNTSSKLAAMLDS